MSTPIRVQPETRSFWTTWPFFFSVIVAALVSVVIYIYRSGLLLEFSPGNSALMLSAAPKRAADRIENHLHGVREFNLFESQSVINVTPRVKLDPRGGVLVADASEAQIRRYDEEGDLITAFGRKGNGPGEFLRLATALRIGNQSSVLAVDMSGRMAVFDSAGNVEQTWQTRLGPVYNADGLGDSLVVLTGRMAGRGESPLIHLWDLRSARLVRSFFAAPTAPAGLEGTYAFAGTSDVATRGDTIAAVFALTDTLYLFNGQGALLERIPIPFEEFRKPKEAIPDLASLDEYRQWASRFSAISQVFWASDGSFLIQYYDTDGVQPKWRLLRMTRSGERVFEVVDSPQLLAAGPTDPHLYFVQLGAETPAAWFEARLEQQ